MAVTDGWPRYWNLVDRAYEGKILGILEGNFLQDRECERVRVHFRGVTRGGTLNLNIFLFICSDDTKQVSGICLK